MVAGESIAGDDTDFSVLATVARDGAAMPGGLAGGRVRDALSRSLDRDCSRSTRHDARQAEAAAAPAIRPAVCPNERLMTGPSRERTMIAIADAVAPVEG